MVMNYQPRQRKEDTLKPSRKYAIKEITLSDGTIIGVFEGSFGYNPDSVKLIRARASFIGKLKSVKGRFQDAFAVPDSMGSSIKFDEKTEAFLRERQWQEYVGRYAALVLADKRGVQLKKNIRGPISFPASKLESEYDEFRVRSYQYQPVADSDFIKYGPRLLSKIVNAKSLKE
ncbi:hypothetical protein HYX19_03020, partial [Candidatus Woesearchaeota archaeon]|nr:hypothetical protein [Candidatus Woesearchaeota archaeon]